MINRALMIDALTVWFDGCLPFDDQILKDKMVDTLEKYIETLDDDELECLFHEHII